MDFEVDGGLLLAESLGTAANNMDSETLTIELIRNYTSIAGNEDQKKASAAKIQQLNENIAAVRQDLTSVQDSVATYTLSATTQDSLNDLQV